MNKLAIHVRTALLTLGMAISMAANGQSGEPIRIGVIHSLTGGQAGIGGAAQHGTRAALEYLNSRGGIMGRRVEVVIRDSGTNPAQAATAARELAADRQIVAIFGSDLTGEVLAMAPPINSRGLPSFQSAVAVSLYDPTQHCCFFLTGNTADQLSQYYVDYLTRTRNSKKLGIIYEAGAFGQASLDATQRAIRAAGREPGVAESFQTGTADVTANLRRLRNQGVDGLVIHTFGPGLVSVLTSLQKLQWPVAATAPLGASSQAVREAVGAEGLKNVAAGPIPKSILTAKPGDKVSDEAREFFESLRKVAGADYAGDIIMPLFTFDKFMILKAAIEGAKSTDAKAIRDYLESGAPHKGVIGTYRYSKGSHIGLGIDRVGAFNPAEECSVKAGCVAAQGVTLP